MNITENITSEIIESAKRDYENKNISFASLAKRYGKNHSFWWRKAKKEGWEKYSGKKDVKKKPQLQIPLENKDEPEKQSPLSSDDKATVMDTFDGILSSLAVRKIKEIVDELGQHYSPIDEPVLVVYAKSYEYFVKLSKQIDEEGISLISLKTGSIYSNPNFNSWLSVGKNIASIGEKIGVTASARKRIGITLGADNKTESLFDFIEKMMDENIDV